MSPCLLVHIFLSIYYFVSYPPMATSPRINNEKFKGKVCVFMVIAVPELSPVPDPTKWSTCVLHNCPMPISESQKENPSICIFYTRTVTAGVRGRVHMIKSSLLGAENPCEWRLNDGRHQCFQIRKHGFRSTSCSGFSQCVSGPQLPRV